LPTCAHVAARERHCGSPEQGAGVGFVPAALPPAEIETAAHYLSGETPQGRIGIGYSTLQAAASNAIATAERCRLRRWIAASP